MRSFLASSSFSVRNLISENLNSEGVLGENDDRMLAFVFCIYDFLGLGNCFLFGTYDGLFLEIAFCWLRTIKNRHYTCAFLVFEC